MALITISWRATSCLLRRSCSLASARCVSGPSSAAEDTHKGKVPVSENRLLDRLGHSVGMDRAELLAREAGDDDPFEMKVIKRSKGSFEDPTIITSPNKERMIGCICEEDSLTINWMYLNKDEPKRCECGYWFKLVDASEQY
ncbi:unnamed protein product [Candidula unifasciata]|uniref:Mitochondrial cytochrome c oxidase subunit Vb n=1 Tax=Candidula unifasciata TaxID=100452 RepID=A0A8S3ZI68_9EUPU|nr:unnamed protein product [Candidula unifasciata]